MVRSASMIRTASPSRQDRSEPSGRCSPTGGLRVDLHRASSIAPVRSTAARNPWASKARSSRTSIPGRSSGSSRRATVASSRSAAEPTVAPSRPRVPVSTRVISRTVGIRPSPCGAASGPARTGCGRCRGLSASCTRRRRPCPARRSTPRGCGAGPAARPPPRTGPSAAPVPAAGADPAAPSDGRGTATPSRPAVSLSHTRACPRRGNIANASRK